MLLQRQVPAAAYLISIVHYTEKKPVGILHGGAVPTGFLERKNL